MRSVERVLLLQRRIWEKEKELGLSPSSSFYVEGKHYPDELGLVKARLKELVDRSNTRWERVAKTVLLTMWTFGWTAWFMFATLWGGWNVPGTNSFASFMAGGGIIFALVTGVGVAAVVVHRWRP